MFITFQKAFSILSFKEKKKLKFVLFLMLFATLFELCGIAILIPLVNFLTNTNFLENFNYFLINYFLLEDLSKKEILKVLFSLILLVFIFKNIYLALYTWFETAVFINFRANLGIKLFKKYINGKYKFFLEKNSSEISSNIIQETAIFGNFFMNFTTLVIESLILFSSVIFLLMMIDLFGIHQIFFFQQSFFRHQAFLFYF
jgi:ABC-type multidrug transport system fused ATPase/permease subunit